MENKTIDKLLELSAQFAKQHRMGFSIEPFPACSGCDFWFRLPRGCRAHAGCAFLDDQQAFLFSEVFNCFGRLIERKEYSYLPIEQLSDERLFKYVLSERNRLELPEEQTKRSNGLTNRSIQSREIDYEVTTKAQVLHQESKRSGMMKKCVYITIAAGFIGMFGVFVFLNRDNYQPKYRPEKRDFDNLSGDLRSFGFSAHSPIVTACPSIEKTGVLVQKSQGIETVSFSGNSNPTTHFPISEMSDIGSNEHHADEYSPSQLASDVNQEMDRKLAVTDLSSAYAEEMIATWRDRTNHELVRNFAVQHLERYARECVVRGTWDPASADAADVRAALEEAVLETGTSVGGAALLALARLSEIDPHVDRTRLGARASSLVSNSSIPAANRVSAAQVCGLLRVRSALPALRALSSDPSVPTPLRLAASHAVKEIEGD